MPLLFLGMLALILLAAFREYWIGTKTYLFKDIGSDTLNSFYPAMVDIAACIQRWALPGWSFHQGMGQNVYPNSLGEPFTWILYGLSPDALARAIAWVEMLKVAAAGALFYWFLRLRNISSFTATLIALSYAFCGTVVVGGGWRVFSTHAVHAALLLVACEQLLQRRHIWLFPLAVALIVAFNPFYAYVFALLALSYVGARYGSAPGERWNLPRHIAVMAGLGLIGVAVSAAFSIPSTLEMLQSPRGQGPASQTGLLLGSPVFQLGDAQYYATLVLRSFSSDLLGTGSAFRGWQNYIEAPMHYCGLLALLLVPQVFVQRKRERWLYGIILGLVLWIQVLPWFRYSFWLFKGGWFRTLSLFFSIILLIYAAKALDGILRKGGLNAKLLFGTFVALLILLYLPYGASALADETLRAVVALFLTTYTALLVALSRPVLRLYAQVGLLVVLGVELAVFTGLSVNRRDVVTTDDLRRKGGYNDETVEALVVIRRQDGGFYRVEKNYSSSPAIHAGLNDGKIQRYFGTTSYHSFNQMNYIKFLAGMGVIDPTDANSTSWAPGLRGRPMLLSFASVRYLLIRGDYSGEPFLASQCTKIGAIGDLNILKNNDFIPLGFGVRQYLRESVHQALDPMRRDAVLVHAFVVPDSATHSYAQFSEWTPSSMDPAYGLDTFSVDARRSAEGSLRSISVSQNRVAGRLESAAPQMIVFSIPFDDGWSATVDSSRVPLRKVDYGLTGLPVGAGDHEIVLRYRPPLLHTGLMVTLVGLFAYAGVVTFPWISRRLRTIGNNPLGRGGDSRHHTL